MSARMIADARRYTKREKQAYHARVRRRGVDLLSAIGADPWQRYVLNEILKAPRRHHFADNLGSRVPTMRTNPDLL